MSHPALVDEATFLAVQGMRRSFELLIARRAELDDAGRSLLGRLRAEAWASADAGEARAALADRRPAVFTGR